VHRRAYDEAQIRSLGRWYSNVRLVHIISPTTRRILSMPVKIMLSVRRRREGEALVFILRTFLLLQSGVSRRWFPVHICTCEAGRSRQHASCSPARALCYRHIFIGYIWHNIIAQYIVVPSQLSTSITYPNRSHSLRFTTSP
jgi:hypothetical protein